MKHEDKFRGGLYGLLIGDALGVPYEFHSAKDIPSYNNIEMIPPSDFKRAHVGVAPGTWSDDRAHSQCLITHGNLCNQVCCALYCLVARFLLASMDFNQALEKAIQILRNIYSNLPEYEQELEWSIRPDGPWEGNGSGYVVDCLRSAFMILMRATNYEEAVKLAIMLGDDTDTTACVTGGLAGILYGFHSIPKRWYHSLRGKEAVEALIQPLF